MNSTVADLMRRNLLDVFNEPDAERRDAAIAVTYAEDVVWHEPDRVHRGRAALARRAAEVLAQSPDWEMRPDGPVSVNDDLGHLAFQYGPAGRPPVVTGMDIAHCRDGVIVELYTFVSVSDSGRPS
ncbi:nuclear transport factor 2 family protein [Kitasatospora xanthocidica]|uniref:nuclear transport factor 2 family protein n=1 Tax=Kitasatospora xanthocidica TaxID=83382 RepID=UPI0036EA69FA